MGELVNGVWKSGWYDPDARGAFQRPKTKFRHQVTTDGSSQFGAEAGRYHLYVSYACPWAHRTLITRALRGLEDAIAVTVVDPQMSDDGWSFTTEDPDPLFGEHLLRDVYLTRRRAATAVASRFRCSGTRRRRTIVNNESREIMRMLDTQFEAHAKNEALTRSAGAPARDREDARRPLHAREQRRVSRRIRHESQAAYEEACNDVFAALDHWDGVLGNQRYLCGPFLTEADVAMFTTLLRFDLVYYAHFKCNVRRIQDYPNLSGYLRDIYQMPDVKKTCRLDHIKTHYYWSQTTVNPHRIVPVGPDVARQLELPHDRARLSA